MEKQILYDTRRKKEKKNEGKDKRNKMINGMWEQYLS